jgi:hypothetical protein
MRGIAVGSYAENIRVLQNWRRAKPPLEGRFRNIRGNVTMRDSTTCPRVHQISGNVQALAAHDLARWPALDCEDNHTGGKSPVGFVIQDEAN